MTFQDIEEKHKDLFNQSVNHPLQAFEWGEFRKKTGVGIIRRGEVEKTITNPYQLTVHKTPSFPYLIGYFPKGELPSKELMLDLENQGKDKGISFFQLEPNVFAHSGFSIEESFHGFSVKPSFHPLFTKYTFILNLTKSEDELLSDMHQKTRYNIRLSQKKGVTVEIDNSDKAFKEYLRLTHETTKRQKFYAHDDSYHKLMWETLGNHKNEKFDPNKLMAHLLTAKYNSKTLVTWVLFPFKNTLYYPYGASSSENREVMASHLTAWEAIRFGKSLGLTKFDMWGAANNPDPKPNDPYFGFHKFKMGFGAELTEFLGSFDFIVNPVNYRLLTVADKLRWAYLKAKKRN